LLRFDAAILKDNASAKVGVVVGLGETLQETGTSPQTKTVIFYKFTPWLICLYPGKKH